MGEHGPGHRRDQAGVIELRLGERNGGLRLCGAGTGLQDGLGARTFLDQLQALGRLGGAGLGDLELGFHALELAVGDDVLGAQFLGADEVQADAFALGLGAAQGGGDGGDLLRAGTGLQFGQRGRDGVELGAAQRNLLFLFGVVELGDELAGLDLLALGDRAGGDAAGDLEAELRVHHLDVAREQEVAGAGAIGAGTGAEQEHGGGEEGGRGETARERVSGGIVFHVLCGRRG